MNARKTPANLSGEAGPAGAAPQASQSAPATKPARQARIVAILSREQVHSQEQLAGLLGRYAGMHVAQATLSRDLDELGVVRLRAADGSLVYALPGDPAGPGAHPGTTLDYPERGGQPSGPSAPGTGGSAGTAGSAAAWPAGAGTPEAPGAGPRGAGPRGAARQPGQPQGAPGQPGGAPEPGGGEVAAASGALGRVARYLNELLTSAEASANLVVLRTPAGAAQFLASVIDHASWPAILGTVAGDDTVLVITRDPVGGDALAAEFRRLAERRR